ncbi:hypothetical protein LCGC14_2000330 [marine sediment metagenome]|uniref:Uncharacterized protein n=1 Tax=marine sediment metagenome TaxID=412755 RepID=A0A0F9FR94_9ZZZZ
MVLATKERIIADRQFATERYILSTMPVLYLPLHRLDSGILEVSLSLPMV